MKINSDALKRLMIEKKWTLKEMSQATGLSTITLAAMLKDNKTRHQYKTLGAWVHGLNVPAEKIIDTDDE